MNYIGINKIKTIFKVAKNADEPVLIIGKHGIGKSQSVEEFAKEMGYYYHPLFLSHQEVADLIGIPVEKNGNTIWTKPEWLQKMQEAEKSGKDCVLFLDELNRSQLDVRQVALQLVLNKQIHQHYLPKNTFIVAAINPTEDNNDYQVEELDAALLDRFLVIEVESNAKEWINYAINKNLHPLVIKFISKFPEYLYKEDENSGISATNRSWEHVSNLLKSLENIKWNNEEEKNSILIDIINGRVGPIPGAKFIDFYKTEKSFSVDELIKYSNMLKKELEHDFDYVYNKIIEANDSSSNITIEDLENDKKLKTFFDKIDKVSKNIKKEWNIEPSESHYLYKNFFNKYINDTKKYFIEMALILNISPMEIIVSFLKTLDEQPELKIKLSYPIPFKIKEIFSTLQQDIEE